ncbi:TolC family protein [Teichococcus cervicalis]|uniref:Outer membrane efflux protein n=1 Tax=Pseudoroseomonas cervicalis ATCC 49957 TaxID=525371 RepID=D5RLY7_9PROT|nr:TolC family protein [Pseudoroseomonas cervicalis]EFH11682.1 outer membrane efflux protein [Pseudoroseomonas cervicalis ATCC 49957]
MPLRSILLCSAALLTLAACGQPRPLSREEITTRATADMQALMAMPEPATQPVVLEEAIARAVKYNLDHRVKLAEEGLAMGQAELTAMDLLPRIGADAAYTWRSREGATSSRSATTGQLSPQASIAEEKSVLRGQLNAGYDLLELGINYARTKQAQDAALLAGERRRKAIQTVAADVQNAYWRAVAAEHLLPELERLIARANQALERSRRVERDKMLSPAEALSYQRVLLAALQALSERRREMEIAKAELAMLMGLPPGTTYQIAQGMPELSGRLSDLPPQSLVPVAFAERPELRAEDYQGRITSREVEKAFLSIFPSLTLRAGPAFDTNRYLQNNQWFQAGGLLSWNLMRIFTLPSQQRQAERMAALDQTRRLQVGMAVMVQVHLAVRRHEVARQAHALAAEAAQVEERLLRETRNGVAAQTANELDVAVAEANALLARVRLALTLAERETAAAQIYVATGLDPLPETVRAHDIPTLTEAVRARFAQFPDRLRAAAAGEAAVPEGAISEAPTAAQAPRG